MSIYPKLNVKKIIEPILKNYNQHVLRFCDLLKEINCQLIYDGPDNIHDHLRDKTAYSCSVKCFNVGNKNNEKNNNNNNDDDNDNNNKKKKNNCSVKKFKILKFVFPVMVGSKLDICIRKKRLKHFTKTDLTQYHDFNKDFESMDIACAFFIINGCVRQLPYFYTNDPTNTHVVRRKIVRCYAYDSDDRGKELSLYVHDDAKSKRRRGDLVVMLNDGSESDCIQGFFDQCPYVVAQSAYMSTLYQNGNFDIDNLGNKIVVSPGHLFVKLFSKYLYRPLKVRDWQTVKSKMTIVIKSIESGSLLHVLSRKTLYFKESKSSPKMVSVPQENHRELGMNGEVYVEKDIGCYREVSMQTYPLNPYLSHMIIRQISSKVKKSLVPAFNESYLGYFCSLGNMETKNIGRTNMMVRNVFVSTSEDVGSVYKFLDLKVIDGREENHLRRQKKNYFVVLNEACVAVSEKCFNRIDLLRLKDRFKYIECYRDRNFILIRYKIGLMFKRMHRDDRKIWVTTRDRSYWIPSILEVINNYENLTGYLVDLNPFFNKNMFTKNILAFNTLKNSVLATDSKYSEYFLETLSSYTELTPYHTIVCEPVDAFSSKFVLYVPLVNVAYMSFQGITQEDCIAVREDVNAFDCYRFHTIRLKLEPPNRYVTFHPKRGDAFPDDRYVGHIVCHVDSSTPPFDVVSQTTRAKLVPVRTNNNNKIFKLYFTKPNFKIVRYHLTENRLSVCLKQLYVAETGDKLCSFHGQKGVIRKVKCTPTFGQERYLPDIMVNPYCLFRSTCGQFVEAVYRGGKDMKLVRNVHGKIVPTLNDDGIFLGKTFYFTVAYWASEHFYAPKECVMDKILGQAVKGRSRGGGMRLGNMEIMNGLRGNGIAACFEEKVLEHGDRLFYGNEMAPLPKSTILCQEDAKFYKAEMKYTFEEMIESIL